MKQLIDILHGEGLTLVIKSADGVIHRFTQRGVKDLLALVTENPAVLHDAVVADKAVGKAAAACMAVGGVRQVHADVMSEPAFSLLKNHCIESDYGELVHRLVPHGTIEPRHRRPHCYYPKNQRIFQQPLKTLEPRGSSVSLINITNCYYDCVFRLHH